MPEEFKKGDAIRVKEGPFQESEGVVDEVFPDKDEVRAIIPIWGRPTPVVFENWMIELA
ncbi:MAG TPA: KOW motif-containing protein [Phycisphaerae bacterium]|nr:KOW motif-containing protein [Phycisphaerae bacterium]